MRIGVTGGTGFVGKVLVSRLVALGHEVTLLARRGPREGDRVGKQGVRFVEGDVVNGRGLEEFAARKDAVIHLVGIIREKAPNTFDRVHRQATARVVEAAAKAGVRRYLHMSALGTRPNAVSAYHKSKWEGERIVRASGLEWTIFRPSIIFGPGDSFINMMADLMMRTPVMPVPGGGKNMLQAVFVEDVAAAYCLALDTDWAEGEVLEVCGPEVLTLKEIIRKIAYILELKRKFIDIPIWLIKPSVKILGGLGLSLPVTEDQLIMLSEDNICSGQESALELPFPLTGLEEGLRRYLKQLMTSQQVINAPRAGRPNQ